MLCFIALMNSCSFIFLPFKRIHVRVWISELLCQIIDSEISKVYISLHSQTQKTPLNKWWNIDFMIPKRAPTVAALGSRTG